MGARNLFVKVNTDPAYRAKFLKDPIRVLRSNGITLSAKNQKELLEVIDEVTKSLPNLGEMPKGYQRVVSAVQKHHRLETEPSMMLV